MPKNIILCSDGTGNTADRGRGTNVFKLFEAVDLNSHHTNPMLDAQLAFYDDGVGTEGIVLKRLLGGATGYGLRSNVEQLYRELSRVYDPGDRIFLFGFSRGAFTVRTLAGMIGACGVLNSKNFQTAKQLRAAVHAAYNAYRAKYDSILTKAVGAIAGWPDGNSALADFHKRYAPRQGVPIAFVGVWDTVDAVGLPFALGSLVNRAVVQFKFPAQDLGEHIECACHALSIDDSRVTFQPVLWSKRDGAPDPQHLEQVWFSGVHSNVGGGYPKQGMSLVALDWMLSQAERRGLRMQILDHLMFRGHASVDDMLYDPRAGLGMLYRWRPRNITAYCQAAGIEPCIHLSVAERIAHGTDDYAPGNIPANVRVVFTPEDDEKAPGNQLLKRRAQAAERVIRTAHSGRGHLLDDVRPAVIVSELSYWIFILAWLLLVPGAFSSARAALNTTVPWTWRVLAETWSGQLLIASAVLFVVGRVLALWAHGRMSDRFSRFWHEHQQDMREAMKQVHRDAREEQSGVHAVAR